MSRWIVSLLLMILVSPVWSAPVPVPCQVQKTADLLTVTCEGSQLPTTFPPDWSEAMSWIVGDSHHPLRWDPKAKRVEWCDAPEPACAGGTWRPVPVKE